MRTCVGCKWLDKTRSIRWHGQFCDVFVCKKDELEQQAQAKRDGKKPYMFAPSYMRTDGTIIAAAYCAEEIDPNLIPYLNELEFDK